MKRFKHPSAPGRIVEADEGRAIYLKASGWVEVDPKKAPAKKAPAKKAEAKKSAPAKKAPAKKAEQPTTE